MYCCGKLRLKICLRIGTNISEPLIINPGMSSPTDLDGLSCLMALIISEPETDKGKNSEDDRMVGKRIGQALLYTDSSATS
jgi:hypothetical protein